MRRFKKVRGQRKKWKDIADWVERCKLIDLEYFESSQRDYVKIWVHPWSGISVTNSEIPEPSGKTRKLMLEGLLAIHNSFKKQLEERNEPYYLKIWLFETHFSRSQVVCATGGMLNFYDQTFFKPEKQQILNTQQFGKLQTQIEEFTWEQRWDEFDFSEQDIGEPDDFVSEQDYKENKRYLERIMKASTTRVSTFENEGKKSTYYSQKTGNVWIGGT